MQEKFTNQIFEKFSQLSPLVIGDVMVDSYLWGNVDRISPEAPIPVVSVTKKESRLGGAANVSLNLKALGANPVLFSVIGADAIGQTFKKILKKKQIPNDGIFTDIKRTTTSKNRIISNGQHIVRIDEETTERICRKIEQDLISAVKKHIETHKVDVIIFVDYDKGVITPTLLKAINKFAILKGIPTTADPKHKNFNLYKNISLFKPNFKEFTEGTGIKVKKGDLETLKKLAGEFKEKQGHKIIFITLSELGAYICDGAEKHYIPAEIRYISDVSGAGDTVISVASLALALKLPPKIIAYMSNIAGALVCEKPGVVPVDKDRLYKEMVLRDI